MGKLGLLLMGGAMLSKSLIQFSVLGQSFVLSLLFDLRTNCGGDNEEHYNLLQQVPCMYCHTQCPQCCSKPSLTQQHPPPETQLIILIIMFHHCTLFSQIFENICPHRNLSMDIYNRQVLVSLLWGQCSFLLGPGAHKVLFVPSKSLFPQSCVSSGSSMVGLVATSFNRAYGTARSASLRASAPVAGHC